MTGILTHRGITPTVVVNTQSLQNGVAVAGTTWQQGQGGTFQATTDNPGICATLTAFWLTKRAEGVLITDIGDFPSAFALSIAQSAYENRGTNLSRSQQGDDRGILTQFGLRQVANTTAAKRKWYMWKTTLIENVAKASTGWPGFYYIAIQGKGGGHAIGVASKGQLQFFDPNFGIMDFGSVDDLISWLPSHVKKIYPDLLDRVEFYAAGL